MILPEVMLAKSAKMKVLDSPEFFAERKFDGTRLLAVKHGGRSKIFTGRGARLEYSVNHPGLIAALNRLPARSFILDGEFTFFDKKGRDIFLTVAAKDAVGSLEYKYVVFDIIELNGVDMRVLPIEKRKVALAKLVKDSRLIVKTKPFFGDKRALFSDLASHGFEGVVLKRKGSRYVGGRSRDWLKVKKVTTIDVIAKGGSPGTGDRKPYFGAVHAYLPDKKGVLRYIGDVGSGFTNADLRKYHLLVKKEIPFVIEVKFLEWTKSKKMRQPSVVRVRTDKNVKDVMSSHD